MANRFQIKQHEFIYNFLCSRDGEYCIICHNEWRIKRKGTWKLEIDHANNNKYDNHPDNLHLVCKEHNLKLRSLSLEDHIKLINKCLDKNQIFRQSIHGNTATHQVRNMVDYGEGSPEMRANKLFEEPFRKWIIQEVTRLGMVEKKQAINSGASMAGCSVLTTRRYIEKLTSDVDVLKEENSMGGPILVLRKKT